MIANILSSIIALGVILLQNNEPTLNSLQIRKAGIQYLLRPTVPASVSSVVPVHSSKEEAVAPVEVVVKLAQPVIRVGDPIVLQYQFVNNSHNGSYAFPLPDQGKAWLTLHLRDKSGKEVGSASLVDFAGERTVRAVTLQNRQQLVWTRLYIWRTFSMRTASVSSSVFADEVTLNALAATATTPGSYTLSAELALPYAVDPLGRTRDTLAYGFPYEKKSKPKGTVFINERTGKKTFVPAPFDPSAPVVPKAVAQIHKTFTLPLEVRERAASVHREAEALAARTIAAYPVPLPDLPLPAMNPPQARPGTTIHGVVRAPYNLQFREKIAGSRADIQALFSLSGPAAQRAQLSVAKTIADTANTGRSQRIRLDLFYQNVALVGTPAVVDFLASQAWDRKRPDALEALATMHEYGGLEIRRKIKEHFTHHQMEIPHVMRYTGG